MDSALQEETRQLGLELAETGLENADAAHFARARLLSCPPPANADLAGALNLSDNLPRCRQLFSELIAVQDCIAPISQVLQELVYFEFRSKALASDELYRVFVDQGVVAEAVTLSLQANPSALSRLVLHFQDDRTLRSACPRLPHLLTAFVKRLKTLYPAEPKEIASISRQSLPEIADTTDPIVTAVEQFMAQHRRDKDKRPAKSIAADSGRQSADKQKTFILQRVNQGRLVDAENALVDLVHNQARNGHPKHLCKSLCDLGQKFTASGHYDLAKRVYVAAQVANPNDAICWTGYAETLRELGQVAEAKTVYEQAKARFDNDAVCWTGYAETLRELGQVEEAKTVYEQAKARFDRNAVCWTGYAETLRELGQVEEAKTVYEQAKARFPKDVYCWNGYAETLRELGQVEQAKAVYQQTMSRFPKNGVARNALACMLLENGQYEEAEQLLTVEQVHSLRDWHDFHVLAMIKLKQGAWEEAQVMLERGAAETPSARSRRVFQTSLAVLALRNKQPELAEGRLEITSAQIIQFPLQAVLRAHALAALRRNSEAGSLLDQVKSHRRSGQIIELAEVLARRYGLGGCEEASPELDKEIEDREFALLLRAA